MKSPRYIVVDGMRLPAAFIPEIFRDACKFKPEDGKIVVATFPKCGTTWTLQIVGLILRKGIPPADSDDYFSLFPFMELTPLSFLQNHRRDGCLKTHLPFDRINFSKDVKYINVVRHPADCVVSFYHHVRFFPIYCFSDGTFDDFFEVFISGENDCGDYFHHLLSWYEHRNEPNVFLLTFEDLKADPRGIALKIAEFLGAEHYQSLIEDDEKILKKVLQYSSLEFMRSTVDRYWGDNFATIPSEEAQNKFPVLKNFAKVLGEAAEKGHYSIGNFIRKGGIGEGKITLSEDQKKRLQNRIREKCGHSDVMDLWKDRP